MNKMGFDAYKKICEARERRVSAKPEDYIELAQAYLDNTALINKMKNEIQHVVKSILGFLKQITPLPPAELNFAGGSYVWKIKVRSARISRINEWADPLDCSAVCLSGFLPIYDSTVPVLENARVPEVHAALGVLIEGAMNANLTVQQKIFDILTV